MIKIFPEGEKISPTIMINEHYNGHTDEDFKGYSKRKWHVDFRLIG